MSGSDIIYAFGSRAREVAEWSVKEKVNLAIALEDLFSVNRVDVVVITEEDPLFAANIIRGERIYCKDEYEVDEYDLYILRRAGDLGPVEKERISSTRNANHTTGRLWTMMW